MECILVCPNLHLHMLLKSPLKYLLVWYAASMIPNVIVLRNKTELSKLRFCKLIEKLVPLNRITVKEGDGAKEQYYKFIEEIVPSNHEKFQSFIKFDDRLDTFYSQFLMKKEFVSLWNVFILVFCLSHSQSSIELGFKTNKDFVVENQSEFSLMALRTVQDNMRSKEVTSAGIKIIKDLHKSVKLARRRYDDYREKTKLEKKDTDKDLKRKIIHGEIEDIRIKK